MDPRALKGTLLTARSRTLRAGQPGHYTKSLPAPLPQQGGDLVVAPCFGAVQEGFPSLSLTLGSTPAKSARVEQVAQPGDLDFGVA